MFNKQKKHFLKIRLLKLLFFSPFLFSIPLFNNIQDANAGIEFQWNEDSGFKSLNWFQKENKRRFRNTIYFFLRPNVRGNDLLKLNLSIPKNFKAKLKEEKISLCKVRIGGFESRTKCLENVPADIELKNDNGSLDIYPHSPIPFNKDSYAVVFKIFNPSKTGLNQFHSYGQPSGKTVSSYLGSWTIRID